MADDYFEMNHVADVKSYKKLDPKEATSAQFGMWVIKKITEIEESLASGGTTDTAQSANIADLTEKVNKLSDNQGNLEALKNELEAKIDELTKKVEKLEAASADQP